MNQNVVSQWVSEVFSKQAAAGSISTKITGTSEKGDGYVGDIVFVQATINTNQVHHLVIKYGKQDQTARESLPIRLAFEREMFVYGSAVPIFREFEASKGLHTIDQFIPKCFGTRLYDAQEIIVLQNLKAIGYSVYNRYKALDQKHMQLTFTNYGKWHGLTMAFKDQHPKTFGSNFKNLKCVFSGFKDLTLPGLEFSENKLYSVLKSCEEQELALRLKRRLPKGFADTFINLLIQSELETCAVLLHGDCWNNNFMFKYDESDEAESVKLLDFQLSKLASPAIDLAYHFYSTCSQTETLLFKELLASYYESLSSTIRSLGSDPEKLFPYQELVRQWNKYSAFGLILASFVVPMALSEREDTFDLEDTSGDSMFEMLSQSYDKNKYQLHARLVSAVKHFLD